ncbi:restriction endonuclease subunit S [Sphaerisporangium sp. B11E5]|uniref:restriction endonuclease subunit S n=1 Tax=Sphaerisporangium sp. B11E5 TaxID=3153563 RepID=UPI00325C940C
MTLVLPALPDGWVRTRIDKVATVNARIGWKALTSDEYQEDGYVFLATPNIKSSEIDFRNVNYITEGRYEESPELKLQAGDVLLAKDGNTLGIVNIVKSLPRPATVNGSIAVLRPFGVDSAFLRYVLASDVTQAAIDMLRGGMGVPHLFQWDINRLPVPRPPMNEQRRIAKYLDVVTSRIDRLVELRRRQTTLIEERSFGEIFNTLRGAGVDGNRKHSGLDWLGDIPASWPVLRVSQEFEVRLGKMLNQERVVGEHMRPYLRVVNVQWDHITTDDLVEMNFPPSERKRYEVLPGDLLINEGGSFPGRAATWDGRMPEIYYQKALHRARSRGRSVVRWLYYCLRLALELKVFEVEGNSTTMTHLTGDQLAAHRFPFPESDVQKRLVSELDVAISHSRAITLAIDTQIRLLQERRQALITAAVTGQFDVSAASGRGVEM